MKLLLISHTCLDPSSNMGKTLLSCLRSFAPGEVAQLYFHCEEPVDGSVCREYYRFTDLDALKSCLFPREYGRRFGPGDIGAAGTAARTDRGLLRRIYRWGEGRRIWSYLLRDTLWGLSRWDSPGLWAWIEDFDPDVLFFAAGDYGFSHRIAGEIARRTGKPLAVSCVDDYYLHDRSGGSVVGRWRHRRFMRTVRQTMERAGAVFAICRSMQAAYGPLFQKPCYLLHTPAQPLPERAEEGSGLSYIGRLELGREAQLAAIGRALQTLALPDGPRWLDVWSTDPPSPALTAENGVRFHGALSAHQARERMRGSLAVIHTESFDEKMQANVRHSVSAKIPDTLMNGPCLIAYAPRGVASMDYLADSGAAFCITDPAQLEPGLKRILTDRELRRQIRSTARQVARENHLGADRLRRQLEELARQREDGKEGNGL